jgi:hypothetical protein
MKTRNTQIDNFYHEIRKALDDPDVHAAMFSVDNGKGFMAVAIGGSHELAGLKSYTDINLSEKLRKHWSATQEDRSDDGHD